MPVIIGTRITAARPLSPNARDLHHLACALFEANDTEAHHSAQDKPFSIWPPRLPSHDKLLIDDVTGAEISKSIELADFDLQTTTMETGYGRDQTGFTGSATLRLGKKATAATRSAFSTLARFAEFCGTGAQTTQGFGATRLASQEWQ